MTNEERSKGGFKDNPQNINKEGRPKGTSLTDKILAILKEKNIKLEELIADLLMAKDIRTTLHTYDHVDGRPMQKTEISTPDEHPFELIITDRRKEDE